MGTLEALDGRDARTEPGAGVPAGPAAASDAVAGGGEVEVRPFPYPYRAMLAICSDLDETPDAETYFALSRFLNTTQETAVGPGVGIEAGNSIYFDMPPGQFSYWNASDLDRGRLRTAIRSGHIDCLHSFGDWATSRGHASRAWAELDRHGCSLGVWVDHGVAPTNFGADIMRGHGDCRSHPAYHADLTVAHGVEYVWRGRVTSVIGQDRPLSFGGLCDRAQPLASAITVVKEAAKQVLARGGSRKYSLHRFNRTLHPVRLRDGAAVFEFLRCNPHPGGVSGGDIGPRIGEVLTARFLDRLAERQAGCILYTHLGKPEGGGGRSLGFSAISAFRRLAEYHHRGEILVTTTRRLLDYCRLRRELRLSVSGRNGLVTVDLDGPGNGHIGRDWLTPERLQGLTLYLAEPERAQLRLRGLALTRVLRRGSDASGRASLQVPWEPLEFPDL
jgi:hypothetical protein